MSSQAAASHAWQGGADRKSEYAECGGKRVRQFGSRSRTAASTSPVGRCSAGTSSASPVGHGSDVQSQRSRKQIAAPSQEVVDLLHARISGKSPPGQFGHLVDGKSWESALRHVPDMAKQMAVDSNKRRSKENRQRKRLKAADEAREARMALLVAQPK